MFSELQVTIVLYWHSKWYSVNKVAVDDRYCAVFVYVHFKVVTKSCFLSSHENIYYYYFMSGQFVLNDVETSENIECVKRSNRVRRRDGETATLYQLREQPQAWLQESSQVLTSLNYDLMKKQGKAVLLRRKAS